MHIAIVAPAFNVAPFLRDTIYSVLDQTHADWSMVIVDDGSTDATAAIAAQFRDERIHLIRQENAGVSSARNAGIALFLRGCAGSPFSYQPALKPTRPERDDPACPSHLFRTSRLMTREDPLMFQPQRGPASVDVINTASVSVVSSWLNLAGPSLAAHVGSDSLNEPAHDYENPEDDCGYGALHSIAPDIIPTCIENDTPTDHDGQGGSASMRVSITPDAFLFLDGDDRLAPDALAGLAETLDDAPWAVAACGRYARLTMNGATRLSRPVPGGYLLEQLATRNLFANGGHLLIRREAIETAGDFRQDLSYGEDWEYWTRLALLGEFVAIWSRSPILFVRERFGSASLSRAADAGAYRPALETIYRNPALADRLGHVRLACLRNQAEAEMAWAVGRELIRHGNMRDGHRWLGRSVLNSPSLKRLVLVGLSWLRFGPFEPYQKAG